MPIAFLEQQFNPDISAGSKGGPGFNTSVFAASSGFEQRNKNWQVSRAKYDVAHGIRDKADMDQILDFFYVVSGKATGFRFKDWSDYQLKLENIGTGDGVKTAYQIIKTYAVGGTSYVREIKKPVQAAAATQKLAAIIFEVYVNSVLKTETTDYTVDYTTGIITFVTPPPNGEAVTINCDFDVPVRFDIDEMSIALDAFELETWDSIPLVEIKPNA